MKEFLIISILTLLLLTKCNALSKMKVIESWKYADYVFPNDESPDSYRLSSEYIAENTLILDASVTGQGANKKIFVTTPRLRKGIPASLSILTSKNRNNGNGNLLKPYPDWSWHAQNLPTENSDRWTWDKVDCDKMISVFRTTVDSVCGRLWVLDTGFLHAINKQVCPPKLLLFDLKSDKLVGKYVFPKDVASKRSLLITTVVDVRNNQCDDVFAYIADVTDFKLIVYDHKRKLSWNIENNLFYPYPLDGTFTINGVSFDLMDGIFGLALGPLENNDRKLYFHSLASIRESWVPTYIIRNQSLFANGENAKPRSFEVSEQTRSSQSASEDMSKDGILFFSLISQNAIACWNSRYSYEPINIEIVEQDDKALQFLSGLKVIDDNLYGTSCRFQNFYTGQMNYTETNFRIVTAPVQDLVQGTKCSRITTTPRYTTFRPSIPLQYQHKPQPLQYPQQQQQQQQEQQQSSTFKTYPSYGYGRNSY